MNSLSIIISLFAFLVGGEHQNEPQKHEIKEGTILVIGNPSANDYKHIQFPKKNIIIKRGGLPNWDSVDQIKVIVTDIRIRSNSNTEVILKRADSRKFFNSFPVIKANLESAIASKELIWP
ncbi:hypothetical protein SAMN04487911_10374 [Arenibacter nanhaiticus]|uniref:Uncharacterized protein n=1 Tax=Arenibacter nanhaiticus TaxID=558155 RepID=A0A1M6C4U3_9FLAO|nr:hypothetical protein [Arenibacter nanhaiticus]SHI55744.1 hypothetical protein SAMN04487911_10374 [Arenibacter nanhaiticus]